MDIPKALGVIIENENGEILLLKRSQNTDHEQGKWENCGGKVEDDETFEAAAKREVKEEIGVEVTELIEVKEYTPEETGKYWIKLFKAHFLGEPEIKEPHMFDEMRWFKKEDLKNVDLASYAIPDFKFLGCIE